jgi:5-methylcytosine-specific restriction enzyme A
MAAISELTDRLAVIAAVEEFDLIGKEAFLDRYGFGPSDKYVMVIDGRMYDSKAIVGAAFGYQYPEQGPLRPDEFSGGKATVVRLLQSLGFDVVERPQRDRTRNPDWTIDEVILAMDLYLRIGTSHKAHPDVIALSSLLNSLPIHGTAAGAADFRNPSGVALKLANLASLDPNYSGKGMASASQTDRAVWNRFFDNREELSRLADAIRSGAVAGDPVLSAPVDDEESVLEGRIVFRRHRGFERNQKIVRRKREQLKRGGERIACEVCGFDFEHTYGDRGIDYIEVHHLVPLSSIGESQTRIEDLAGLCANCHRMVHRSEPWLSPAELRSLIEERRRI